MIRTLTIFGLVTLIYSCNKDESYTPVCDGSSATYNGEIAAIINTSCTNSGCHSAGSSNGDYTSYDLLNEDLVNGKFQNRVLVTQDMPKGSSLSESQLNMIQCWVENNYPE